MSKIDYTSRLNKQVERRIIIDILSQFKNEIRVSDYTYVGMGALYYYDFVLMHKAFGIKKQISMENGSDVNRFLFNKPYDFIDFRNMLSTDYLLKVHDWDTPSIIWLDYETSFIAEDNDFVIPDLKILGKNCKKNTIIFITINSQSPKDDGDNRRNFLEEYQKYISPELNTIKNTTRKRFAYLIQDIWINILKESCEYNDYKFRKICSFKYQDGAEMYTLGGVFTDDEEQFDRLLSLHDFLSMDITYIQDIFTPHVTSKERSFINSIINALGDDISSHTLPFEISKEDLVNYIKNYRYIPTYYEGII